MVLSFIWNDGKVLADLHSFGNEFQIINSKYQPLYKISICVAAYIPNDDTNISQTLL